MLNYDFANEKAFKKAYGLRYQPDRYVRLETATTALRHYIKPHRIIEVKASGFISGYYIVCPADASRLERAGYKVVSPFN